jgi:hypothetical protein
VIERGRCARTRYAAERVGFYGDAPVFSILTFRSTLLTIRAMRVMRAHATQHGSKSW